jgi:outer membrane protein assembly factor BamB
MEKVLELTRRPSPGGRPQPLAYLSGTLWVGSWDTHRIYAIDPKTWNVREEIEAPGKPYGLAAYGAGLRAVIAHGEEEDRFFYDFVPGRGFDLASKKACPDFTGSHLASDGTTLYMTQMGFRRILAFGPDGAVLREVALVTRCGGIGVRDGTLYMIAADEEFENLELATLDVTASAPQPVLVASLPFDGRALTFNGSAWWTSDREINEIVSFAP